MQESTQQTLDQPNQKHPVPPHPVLGDYYQDEHERRDRLDRWFDVSAPYYDQISQMMSFGSGHWYRRKVLHRTPLSRGMRMLDVATGTGMMAHLASEIVGPSGQVAAIDASLGMLKQAVARNVKWVARAKAERLPFPDDYFDLLNMGYALRHVSDLVTAFREYKRVLKPGGTVLILEITPPRRRAAYHLFKLFLKRVVPAVTLVTSRNRDAKTLMSYYWETVEQCVPKQAIMQAMEQVGLINVSLHVDLGIFSEYTAQKPVTQSEASGAAG